MENLDGKSKEFLEGYKAGVIDAIAKTQELQRCSDAFYVGDTVLHSLFTRKVTKMFYVNIYKCSSINDYFLRTGKILDSKQKAEELAKENKDFIMTVEIPVTSDQKI